MTNFLTIPQACRHLNVCRNTLLAMIADGRVKAIDIRKLGGKNAIWRIDISVLGAVPEAEILERLKLREIEKRMGI